MGIDQDFSNRKAREMLGWAPRVDYAEGMETTVAWLRDEHLAGRSRTTRAAERRRPV
jgi:nucleoside-diphosphate-sugar epimerase